MRISTAFKICLFNGTLGEDNPFIQVRPHEQVDPEVPPDATALMRFDRLGVRLGTDAQGKPYCDLELYWHGKLLASDRIDRATADPMSALPGLAATIPVTLVA